MNETWVPPTRPSHELVAQAQHFVRETLKRRPPADMQKQLAPRVASFLCHFFTALSDDRLNAMVAHDWLNILKDLPIDSVQSGFMEWGRTSHKKPTPADIRRLAIDAYPEKEWKKLLRAKTIADMPGHDVAPQQSKSDFVKDSPEKVAATLAKMHEAGFHTSKRDKCPICAKETT